MVEHVVRRFGPISRAQNPRADPNPSERHVADRRHLLAEGRLVEDGVEERAPRPKGALLRLNEDSAFVAALQFDDETITAGVANLRPTLIKTRTATTPLTGGVNALVRQLIAT